MTIKMTLAFFTSVFFAFSCYSQGGTLPTDENGRYAYIEVVQANGFDSLQLLNNAEAFTKGYINKKQKKTLQRNDEEGYVSALSSFLVYKKGSLGKHVDGAIEYSIKIEVKDQRFRYTLTDFYFQEYVRDRYGKFKPTSKPPRPLETESSKLNEWQWEAHQETVDDKMTTFISTMNVEMMALPEKEKTKKKKDDW